MQNKKTGSYVLKLTADSGYEAEHSGRISPDEWGAVIAVLERPEILKLVTDAIVGNVDAGALMPSSDLGLNAHASVA